MLGVTYILPLRHERDEGPCELDEYINRLGGQVELIVVDGSPLPVFAAHAARWRGVEHVTPDPGLRCLNGKVWGVLSGLQLASHERVIVADDDVRYDAESLRRVAALLEEAGVVRPQNYFQPLPWHARWDSSRSLLNRLSGGDWPGTIGVRREFLPYGYDGGCLFENLEMVRTAVAAGAREVVASDVFVRRLPPTPSHFFSQRVRQAYDEWARPKRFAAQLAMLPAALLLARRLPLALPIIAGLTVLAAEAGRRRDGGTMYFPVSASMMAPLWVGERAVCAWLALCTRLLFGGVRYHGVLVARPATPLNKLRARPQQAAQRGDEARAPAGAMAS